MKFHNVVTLMLVSVSAALVPVAAQDVRGTVLGRVTDPTGAIVTGAKVSALNTETGVRASSTSNSAGDYILTYLLPGPYNLVVEQSGFKNATRGGIVLREGDRISADIRMEIGDATQTVEVSAAAPLLDTSTASLGQTVDQREIRDLPTKDGMVLIVATFAPGVTFTPQSAAYIRPFDTSSPSQMTVNGTRPGSNEFQVDGMPNLQGQQIAYSPPQSVVGEMKVQTSTFDASWGFNTGAVMNMVLKSGANALHGNLEYFMQNPILNSDNFFRLSTGKPGFRIHRYGASANGPVVLPKIYNGRNRTFFTYGFEGIWSFDPSPWVVETVPTAAERTGNLSALLAVSPNYQIYDPYSTTPASGGRFQRNPLPNNIIPASMINPVSAKIANLWDRPNQTGNADGLNNYTMGKNAQDTYYNHLARLDHNFSDKQRMYARYNQTTLERPENIRQNKTVGDNFYRFNHGAAIDHVYIVSPSFIIDSRYSFLRFTTGYLPYQQGWDLAGLGFSSGFLSQVNQVDPRAVKFPNLNLTSGSGPFSPLGGVNSNNQQVYMTHEGAVSLTNIIGRHTLRFGLTYRDLLENAYDLGSSSGSYTFDSTYTNGPFNTSAAAPLGQEFASFLYGLPGSGSIPINDSFAEKTRYWALYVQDDWKVSTKLTVSAGLRYELPSPLTERFNRSVKGFAATGAPGISSQVVQNYAQNPIPQVPASAFHVNGGLTFAGTGNLSRNLWNTANSNFMPRIGIAYSLSPTTVIRTGYGIYYAPLGVTNNNVNQTGFSATTAYVGSLDNGQTYVASLANPFPGGLTRPVGAAGGLSTFLGQNITFFDQSLRNPYAQRWQFAVQHQFPVNVLLEVSYVGNRGVRVTTTQDRNFIPGQYLSTSPTRDQNTINALGAAVPNPFYPLLPRTNLAATTVAVSQLLRPYPQFSGISEITNGGASWYHGLQARVQKRFSGGISATYSFSWSKFMEATAYLNPFDTRPEHVISDQDRTLRSVITTVYELPFGRGKSFGNSVNPFFSRVIGGWQLQGVYTNQSGQALGFGNAILTCALNQVPLDSGSRSINQWFNTSCFNRVSSQQLASNVRTLSTRFSGIRGPGLNNLDFSVIKNTTIREGLRLQFLAEGINVLNHAQFTNPNTTATSSALGQVTGTFSWQRIIELGLRLSF